MEFWEAVVRPRFPNLTLMQTDPSSLRPSRKTDRSALAPIDFIARDVKIQSDVFGIENKTGRSSIREMSAFQLDVSDCNTIMNEMKRLKIPAYLIHVQVLEEWYAPTMKLLAVGLWWSDVYPLAENFKEIKARRDERRGAAFFNKKAFFPIDSLVDALKGRKSWSLLERFRRERVRPMYL